MIILRDTLGGLLYSRYTLPYLHWKVAVQFPLVVRISQPIQDRNSLLCLLMQRHEDYLLLLSFRDVPERVYSACCSCPALCRWCLHIMKAICRSGLSLLFLCQLIVGNSPLGHRCRLGERRHCSKCGDHGCLGHFM